MALSQIQLEAFQEVARSGSFTKAAGVLNLTQSALSHRIKNLETDLSAALFVRLGRSVRLTELGTKLLQYCRVQTQAEEEFLADLIPRKSRAMSGTLRIGGTSTLVRSAVLPVLGKFMRANPDIRLELFTRELRDLPRLLTSGEADMLVTCGQIELPGVTEEILGHEENVLIESREHATPQDIYLDHDPQDQTTYNFLKLNGERPSVLKRSFMDDVYGILDGVREGYGRAVAPLHLIDGRKDLKMIRGFKPLKLPVRLYYISQPYYTKLHLAALHELKKEIPQALK